MNKSTKYTTQSIPLSELSTWQSGIFQAAAVRNVRKITDDYLQTYSISTNHWYILGAIQEAGDAGIRITDLANRLDVTIGYLTTAVNSLSLRGMVVREDHSTDTRAKMLKATPSFISQYRDIEEGLRQVLRKELYVKLTRDELSSYITVLQKLSNL